MQRGGRKGNSNNKSANFKKGPAKKSGAKKSAPKEQSGIRLNKYIANSGVCSRREADMYIATGQVMVNGQVVDHV